MNGMTEDGVSGFADYFRNCGGRMDRHRQLLDAGIQEATESRLGNELCRVRSNDVNSEQVIGVGVGDNLGEPVGVPFDNGFGVGAHWELSDLDFVSQFSRLSFCESYRTNFGLTVRT